MNPRRKKALERTIEVMNKHKGHEILVGSYEKTRTRHVFREAKIINDNLMVHVEGEAFPTVYGDSMIHCITCEKL